MNKEKAQEVVRTLLNETDRKEFDTLVESMKDPDLITQEELIEGSTKLTELFFKNRLF